MSWFDWSAVVVVASSLVLGVFRGFVREVFSLVGWLIAGAAAALGATTVAALLPEQLAAPTFRWLIAFVLVFLGVLIVAGFFALTVSKLVRAAGLGISDRFLGAMFGAARGVLMMVIFILAIGMTPLTKEPFWAESVAGSRFARPLQSLADTVRPLLPMRLPERFGASTLVEHFR